MMDEFIHWPKPYLLLSATCDEILSWMIEIWMTNHLVTATSQIYNLSNKLQGVTNDVGLTLGVGGIIPWFTVRIEQANQNWQH